MTANGLLKATGAVSATASTVAALLGAVDAGTTYTVMGNAVMLGDATGTDTQSAGGTVSITSTGGGTSIGDAWSLVAPTSDISFVGDVTASNSFALTTTGTIAVDGVTVSGASHDISLVSTGTGKAVTANGALSATRDVILSAGSTATGGVASVLGTVSAGRDYLVTGQSVVLGDAAGTDSQSAARAFTITSGTGGTAIGDAWSAPASAADISFIGDVTATSSFALNTSGTIAVDGVTVSGAGNGISLVSTGIAKDVTANGAQVAPGSVTITAGTVATGGTASALGAVTATSGALAITGKSVTLGDAGGTDTFTTGTAFTIMSGTGGTLLGDSFTLSALTGPVTFTGTVTGNASLIVDTAGAVSVGDVALSGATHDISLNSQGSTVTANALSSERLVNVDAAVAASVTGAVSAGTDYTVRGSAVTLGTAATAVAQSAAGAVTIIASAGNVTGDGTLTLTSNSDQTGTEALLVSSTFGNIALGAGSSLIGGSVAGRESAVMLDASTGTHSASFGKVDALSLTATGASGITAGGAITTTNAVSLSSAGVVSVQGVETKGAAQAISLTSINAGVTANGLLKATGDVTVDATTAAAVLGDVDAGGNYLAKGASVALGNATAAASQMAVGTVTVMSLAGDVTGGSAGVTLQSNSDQAGTEALTVTSTGGNIALGAGSSLIGGSIAGRESAVVLDAGTGSASFGTVDALSLTVTGAGGITAGGAITTTNAVSLSSAGAVSVQGVETKGAAQAISLTSTGAGVTANGLLKATGDVSVDAVTAASVLGDVDSGGNYLAKGASVVLGNATPGALQKAAGTVTVMSSAGDVTITDNVMAGGLITIGSSADIRLAGDKVVTSTGGSIGVTATGSVFEVAGKSATPLPPQIGSFAASDGLAISGSGDIRANSLTSSLGAVDIQTTSGALTGTNGALATITGGKLSALGAGQSVTVTAGNAVGDVAYLGTIEAGNNVTVSANGIGINTLTSGSATAGTAQLTSSAGGLNLGTATVTGTAMLALAQPVSGSGSLVSSDATLDAGFGKVDLNGNSLVFVQLGDGPAQIGNAIAGGNVSLTASALTVDSATATTGALTLTATTGGLYLGTGSARTTATLTKQGGALGVVGDELRITTSLSSGGDTVVLSETDVRLATIDSSSGNVSVAATNGDVTGLATTINSRALTDFGRGNLTASATDKLVSVSAILGAVQLGTISAGAGTTTLAGPPDQVSVVAKLIDINTVDAVNGSASLRATAGTVRLGMGNAGTSLLVDSSGDLTLGTLTAAEDIGVRTGGVLTLTSAEAGDDLVIVTTGAATVATAKSLGTGPDTRHIDFGAILNIVVGEDAQLGRSNITVDSGGALTLGNADAKDSLALRTGAALDVTASLTAGEDISTHSTLDTSIALATAGDDLDVTASGGNILLTTANATGTGADDRRIDLTGTGIILAGSETLGRSNIAINGSDAVTVTAATAKDSVGLRAAGVLQAGTVAAGEDATFASGGSTTIASVTAGDDVDVTAGGITIVSAISLGTGADDRRMMLPVGSAFFDAESLGRSNIVANSSLDSNVTMANAHDTLGLRAAGTLIAGTLVAGEDATFASGGGGTITSVMAGDDVDATAGGSVTITTAKSLGTGADDRKILLPGGSAFFTAENLTRSNIIALAGTNASVTTGDAKGSIAVRAQAGDVTSTTLTAIEDVALMASGDVGLGSISAGDDLTVTAGANVSLLTGLTTGAGLDDRQTLFGATITLANSESVELQRSNAVIDAGGSATIGSLTAAASLTTRAGLNISSDTLLQAGEDIGLVSGGSTTLISAIAGDDLFVKTSGVATLTSVQSTGAGPDDRRLNLGPPITISNGEDAQLGRSNITLDSVGDVKIDSADAKATLAIRSGGRVAGVSALTSFSAKAGEDIAVQSMGDATLGTALAGDDIVIKSLAGSVTLPSVTATGIGLNDRQTDLSGAGIVLANPELLDRSNIIADAATNVSITIGDAAGTIAVFARGGSVTGGMLTAGEDITTKSSGATTISSATAGDDIDITSGGAAMLGTVLTKGTAGSDIRKVTFGTPITITTAEDPQRTRSNITVDATGPISVAGSATAKDSLTLRSGSTVDAPLLTAGEDLLVRGVGGVTLGSGAADSIKAGDDVDITSVAGAVSLTNATTTGLGADNRKADLSGAGIVLSGAETLARSNILVDAATNASLLGTITAKDSATLRAGGALDATTLVAGEDVAVLTGGVTKIVSATAGDDLLVKAGTSADIATSKATGLGMDDRKVTFGATSLTIASGEDVDRSGANIIADAAIDVTLGTADAKALIAARAGSGNLTATTLTAGEDIATSSGGTTAITTATAGDDVDLAATGSITLTTGTTNRTAGTDIRRVTFIDPARISTSIEMLGASNIAVATLANATLGNLDAANSIAVRAMGSIGGATQLKAGEDIATLSGGTTFIDTALAGDDIDITATGIATLNNGTTSGVATLDTRRVDFGGARIGFGAETLGRSDIAVNTNVDASLGTLNAVNSIGVVAGGSISGATLLTAGEDIATKSGTSTLINSATAGDDIIIGAGTSVTLGTATSLGTTGSDTRQVMLGTPIIITAAEPDAFKRSNIAVDAGTNIMVTTLLSAKDSAMLRAGGALDAATLVAGEDIAVLTGGMTKIVAATAGDDLLVKAGTSADITTSKASGLGVDDRKVTFGATSLTIATGEDADRTGADIIVDAATDVTLGLADAKALIAARAVAGNITATTLTAGEDIATKSGGNTTITTATAGDDIDLTATGSATLTTGTTTGLGVDTRRVTFTDPNRISTSAETLGRSNVVADAGTTIALGTITAKDSIVARAGTDLTASLLTAGEDVALKAGNDVAAATATAGDDLTITAGRDAVLTTGLTTGAGKDDRSVTFGTAITIAAASETETLIRSNAVIDAGGNISITDRLVAANSILTRAGLDVTAATLTAGEDIGILTGKKSKVTTATAGDDLVIRAGTAVDLATGTATGSGPDDRKLVFGTNTLSIANGETSPAFTGRNIAITALTDQLSVNNLTATDKVTLAKQGTIGDLAVTGDINAGGNITITSASDVRLANDKAVTSSAGSIGVTAAGSVFALDGATAVTNAQIDTISVSTNLTIIGVGDVRANKLESTGGLLDIKLTNGALTGTTAGGGGTVATISGGKLSAVGVGQSVIVTAGSAVDNVANLRQVDAGMDVTITAAAIGVSSGSVANASLRAGLAGPGLLTVNTLGAKGLNLGLTTVNGGAVLNIGPKTATLPSPLYSPTPMLDANFGTVDLVGKTGINISVANALAQVGTASSANGAISFTGRALTTGTANAGGALTMTATEGGLYLGTGSAGTGAATLTKQGGLIANSGDELRVINTLTSGLASTITSSTNARLGSVVAVGGRVDVIATTGAVTGIAGGTPAGRLETGFGGANLASGGASNGTKVTAATTVQLGTVTAPGAIEVAAQRIDLTSATSTGGLIDLNASTGDLFLGQGNAATTAKLTKTGGIGEIQVTTSLVAGGDATINSSTNARLKSVASTTGAIAVTTTQATTGIIGGNSGNSDPAFGRGDLVAAGAGKSVTVTSGGITQLGTVTAGKDVTINAGNATSNGAIDVGDVSAASGALLLSARAVSPVTGTVNDGDVIVNTGRAGTTATLTNRDRGGTLGNVTASTSLSSGGDTTIDSSANTALGATSATKGNIKVTTARIALNGLVTTTAGQKITLINRAETTNNTIIGGANVAEPTDFVLSDAEIDRISTESLTIESGVHNVAIGALSLKAATGSLALNVLSHGPSQIAIDGVVSEEATAARNVQIGGTANKTPTFATADTAAAELASSIIATTQATGGGRLILPGATLELRAGRVIFGLAGLVSDTRILTPSLVALTFVSRPDSRLYNSIGGYDQINGAVLLQAGALTLRYTDFALFQNTAPAGLNTGVVLGPNTQLAQAPARLTLYSTGETPLNSIGLFGTVNGFTGNAAGLLPNDVVMFRDAGAGNARITRSASRLNGCAIGAPEQGCLTTQSPPPVLRLFDERQALIFRTADDAILPFDPLIGTNNESLFIDFGGVSLPYDDAECTTGAASENCPPAGDKK